MSLYATEVTDPKEHIRISTLVPIRATTMLALVGVTPTFTSTAASTDSTTGFLLLIIMIIIIIRLLRIIILVFDY